MAQSQSDFFTLYRQIDNMSRRHDLKPAHKITNASDTAEIAAMQRVRNKFYADSVIPVLKDIRNLSFPDISFTDAANVDHSVSDFEGNELIINYNYLYCSRCMNRIDSTLKRTGAKPVKMLVLISDLYRKEISDLQPYGQNIIAGFINEDTSDLISLGLGQDCMYYLNRNRQIEFFDRSEKKHQQAWLSFLDERFK